MKVKRTYIENLSYAGTRYQYPPSSGDSDVNEIVYVKPVERLFGKFWTLTGFSGVLIQVGDHAVDVHIHGRNFRHRVTLPFDSLDRNMVPADLATQLRWLGILPTRRPQHHKEK